MRATILQPVVAKLAWPLQAVDCPFVGAVGDTAFDVLRVQLFDAGFHPQRTQMAQLLGDIEALKTWSCPVMLTDDEPTGLVVSLELRLHLVDGARFTLRAEHGERLGTRPGAGRLVCSHHLGSWQATAFAGSIGAGTPCQGTVHSQSGARPGNFFAPQDWARFQAQVLLPELQP